MPDLNMFVKQSWFKKANLYWLQSDEVSKMYKNFRLPFETQELFYGYCCHLVAFLVTAYFWFKLN